jgi:hypothetical protein
VKAVATYFHRLPKGADLKELRLKHRQQFPGNELAVLEAKDGTLLVKVAYPVGTPQPKGTVLPAQVKSELPEEKPLG